MKYMWLPTLVPYELAHTFQCKEIQPKVKFLKATKYTV